MNLNFNAEKLKEGIKIKSPWPPFSKGENIAHFFTEGEREKRVHSPQKEKEGEKSP